MSLVSDKEGHIMPIELINVTDNVTDSQSTAEKRRLEVLHLMRLNAKITTTNIANHLSVTRRTIARDIELLKSLGKLIREWDDNNGKWIVKY